jgi:hypothetical protein
LSVINFGCGHVLNSDNSTRLEIFSILSLCSLRDLHESTANKQESKPWKTNQPIKEIFSITNKLTSKPISSKVSTVHKSRTF